MQADPFNDANAICKKFREITKESAPGEARTHNLSLSQSCSLTYKSYALTDCATGAGNNFALKNIALKLGYKVGYGILWELHHFLWI